MESLQIRQSMPEKSGMGIPPASGLAAGQPVLKQEAIGVVGDLGVIGENDKVELPTFTDRVCEKLPGILREVAAAGESPQETDALLLGADTVFSSCLPGVQGRYDGVTVFPNLFYFLTARAASGKGRIELCRLLIRPVHQRLKNQHLQAMAKYVADVAKWEVAGANRGPKPANPPLTMLIIPANSSATAVYQLLGDNHGKGLIFESEGDTLANAFEADYANYSDGFRKAFHHECISYHRRTGDEDVEIEKPQLSTVLAGTPRQILSLIKDAENGLFSRFIFYRLETELRWRDVLGDQTSEPLDEKFSKLGDLYLGFYDSLVDFGGPINFTMTQEQRNEFNKFFSDLQKEYYDLFKDDIVASIRRMGLVFYRVAMIISALRLMDTGELTNDLVCTDEDFKITRTICSTLIVHTSRVFDELTTVESSRSAFVARTVKQKLFLEALPNEFSCQDYQDVAERTGVKPSTCEKWVRSFCEENGPLERVSHGQYRKRGK